MGFSRDADCQLLKRELRSQTFREAGTRSPCRICVPVKHQLSPGSTWVCGWSGAAQSALGPAGALGTPLPQTPPHLQPWPLPLLSPLSSVFRAERRAKEGRGPEGEQGGSGERAEILPKRELIVLVGEHTSERLTLAFFDGDPRPSPEYKVLAVCCLEEVTELSPGFPGQLTLSFSEQGQGWGQEATPAAVLEVYSGSRPWTYVYLSPSCTILNVVAATGRQCCKQECLLWF